MGVPPRSTLTVVGLKLRVFMDSPGTWIPKWLPDGRSLHETLRRLVGWEVGFLQRSLPMGAKQIGMPIITHGKKSLATLYG